MQHAQTAQDNFTLIRMHGVADVLREHRRSRPTMQAVVDGDVRLTWPELDARVNRLAHALQAAGVTAGERILWLGQNDFRVLECLLAAAKLGAIFCPANWRQSAHELVFVIEDFKPVVVLWQQLEVGEAVAHARELSQHPALWVQADDETGYEQWIAGQPDIDIDIRVDADTPLLAIYTAAFGGHPNAALLTQGTILYQGLMLAYTESISESAVFLNSGPLFHLGTLTSTLATYQFGGKNVFIARVDAERMLQLIEQERVTHAFVAQPTLEQIRQINADGRFDVSSLWSSPLAPEWTNPMVMPQSAPLNRAPRLYGQTELMGFTVMGWLGGEGAGRPSPLVQVRILDDGGQEVPEGTVGEISVRGAQVMAGYFDRDEENQQRTAHGWYRTRDLGKRLPDGAIAFVGPKTTMIKSGVENIYPAEIESCLRMLPQVLDACVIGVPDPVWSQNVKALVVLRAGQHLDAQALIEHCRVRMASYKKPKVVEFVNSLPRGRDGQLDRDAANELHGGGGYPSTA
ncbi:AMP-binding protein [Pseudomonas sp. GD03860]|uniref:AMP-binding protein n=1 Tax=Pseudomonas TaxID=286 RepID=UPI0023634630|nr:MULTISPECIES: AMP-binding protein [Pseudomonas]MDD2058409.1 AMP-binding protein [Pseudomonas putida]MDH0640221.1 AMP-binding protein [Pseudomonas sp. GD03860]